MSKQQLCVRVLIVMRADLCVAMLGEVFWHFAHGLSGWQQQQAAVSPPTPDGNVQYGFFVCVLVLLIFGRACVPLNVTVS